jgi:serine/threonine protein kinase
MEKLKRWDNHSFGNLKFIIGFACGGEFFTFCAMSSCGKIFDISRVFNLGSVIDRFDILLCVINLARLFRTLAHRFPKGNLMMYKPIQRLNGCTIEIRDDYVLKRIPVSIYEFKKRYKYLDTLYTVMLKERVPHVIECWEISKSSKKRGETVFITLKLKPCGLEIMPNSQTLLLSALRSMLLALEGIHRLGYVHRDIRWPNILLVSDDDWRLIDFENSSPADPSLKKKDMRMVGELMSHCESLLFSSEVLLHLREQLLSERPPDASEALAILGKISD